MNEGGISKHDQVLASLVFSLQAAAMQHLGKVKNPITDELERDLDQARGTIDILDMLKAKCRQDTAPEILRILDAAVMDLQMNFLDEVKRDKGEGEGGADDVAGAAGSGADPASDEPAESTEDRGEGDPEK